MIDNFIFQTEFDGIDDNCALCGYWLGTEETYFYEIHPVIGNYDHDDSTFIKHMTWLGGYYCQDCAEVISMTPKLRDKFTGWISGDQFEKVLGEEVKLTKELYLKLLECYNKR